MFRRGLGWNLVEMDHAAAASRQLVHVKFDPLHNGLDRPILKELSVNAGGYKGIVRISKFPYTLRPNSIQVRIQHT